MGEGNRRAEDCSDGTWTRPVEKSPNGGIDPQPIKMPRAPEYEDERGGERHCGGKYAATDMLRRLAVLAAAAAAAAAAASPAGRGG